MSQPKRVIFLDFDGVLNSMQSFKMEMRKTNAQRGKPVSHTLSFENCSNFQYILDMTPNTDIVISSTWREYFKLDELKQILTEYGVDASRVIGQTPVIFRNFSTQVRGDEIQEWLDQNPGYDRICIIDDNFIGNGFEEKHKNEKKCLVQTQWMYGLNLDDAMDAIAILGGHSGGQKLPW